VTTTLLADVPLGAHAKAVQALDEFDALVSQYEMLLDTQQAHVRTANFPALFESVSSGDVLAREAVNCGKRFKPLLGAVAAGQFAGPRANEIRLRSLAAFSRAGTLDGSAARLADACREQRDAMGRELRAGVGSGAQSGLPPAYRGGSQRLLDRRG
jgi:hypothetical protein